MPGYLLADATKLWVMVDAPVAAEVRRRARAEGRTVSAWLRDLVGQRLAHEDAPAVDGDGGGAEPLATQGDRP